MSEKWKSTIGIELQELLRRKGGSQGKLAAFLGVKAASVTYLFQGKIKLTPERLEQIMLFLHAEAAVIQHFDELLRTEGLPHTPCRSACNSARFACRCRTGLTAEQIFEQTGIAPERLHELENNPEATPAVGEVEALKEVYGCEAGVLWGIVPVTETQTEKENGLVHEPVNELLRSVQISVIDCAGLGHYRENCDFPGFLKSVRTGVETIEIERNRKTPAAKVLFSSSRLGWDMKGMMEIFLGMPENEATPGLYLGRGTHGVFRLWKRRGHFWTPFFSAFGEKKSKPAWFLPVTEFCFHAEQ